MGVGPEADHTTGVQVQTYSAAGICLWGELNELFISDASQKRTSSLYLTSGHMRIVAECLLTSSKRAPETLLTMIKKRETAVKFAGFVSLWMWGLISVWCTHICGLQVLISQTGGL